MATKTLKRKSPDRDAVAEYLRRNLTAYKRLVYRRYIHARHLALIDSVMTSVTRYTETDGAEGDGRVIISMPPRHGKTLTVSRLFPSWYLGRNPDHRVLMVSYGASLSERNSRAVRNICASPRWRDTFDLTLDPASQAVDAWDIAGHEGGLEAMGIGGSVTGKGANLLVLDDPVKNREEAESSLQRDKVWESFTNDLYTRLEPHGAVALVMTRWHQDDLAGRLIKQQPDTWRVIRIPAIAEADDALGRQPGAALWPGRFDERALAETEWTIGPYSWSALYQQSPTPAEGGIFKRAWMEPVAYAPEIVRAVRFWDLAMSENASADYTVGVKIGVGRDGHYYVMDVARMRIEWGELTPYLTSVILKDGPAVTQGIEQQGYMSRAVKELNSTPTLHRHKIFGYPVDRDKFTRALPVAARFAAGNMHTVSSHWTQAYIEELCAFNRGAHDDQVDATSGAWAMLDKGAPLTVETKRVL